MSPAENIDKPRDAHAAPDSRVSIISSVRTGRGRPDDEARIEVLTTKALKNDATEKAKAEGTPLSSILQRLLLGWLAGSFFVKRQRWGRGARQIQAAELHQGLVLSQNLLFDLTNIAVTNPNGPLASEVCQAILEECRNINADQLEVMSRYVP